MMADNVHRKSHKQLSDGSRKVFNPVHRTTTETIRLGELDKSSHHHHHHHHHQPVSLPTQASNAISGGQGGGGSGSSSSGGGGGGGSGGSRKKTSSFQITSVTVGCRMSNDAGEDSNDDLDESHTEDNSVEHSRITDIDLETPSYSEDTFSKEDVFFNTSNAALSTAPVIPTSSQYGLAIVPSEGSSVSNSVNDSNISTLDITSVTDNNIINLLSSNVKQDADLREVHSHGRNERFKVVKIESTEPFKRGRWTCMDYLDHTSVNQPTAISTPKVSDPNEVCISYGVTDSGVVVPEAAAKQPVVADDKGISIDTNGQVSSHPQDAVHTSIAVSSNPASVSSANYAVNNSIPPNVQHNPTQVQAQTSQQVQPNSAQIPQYFQSQTQPLTTSQQQQSQSQQQQSQQSQQPQQQQQPQPQASQGSTLSSNLQSAHPSSLGQPQSMPQGSIPIIAQTGNSGVTPQQSITPHSKDEATSYVTVNAQNAQSMPVQGVCQPTVQQTSSAPASQGPNILVTQHQSDASCQQPLQTQNPIAQISEPLTAIQGMQGMQNIHNVPQTGAQQASSTIHPAGASVQSQVLPSTQMQPQTSSSTAPVQITQVTTGCQNVVGGLQQGNIAFHQSDPQEQESITGIVANATAVQSADATLLESLAEVTQGSDENRTLEDNESMSGTSAVAIDNKIEQAMDLVKSHLMFAVREEVEVLKEKIAELMDRINQLEAENSILKAHATPETLAQLSQSTAKLPQNGSGSGQ